jgi:hypothetical protein
MGIFSFFKKEKAVVVVPDEEQQKKNAVSYVESFLNEIFTDFDKEGEGEFECARFKIAGITNYCSRKDIGMISGVSFVQSGNPYDKTAIALGRVKDGKVSEIFGYIPKEDKKDFNKFSGENKNQPFLGYIREFIAEDGKRGIMGIVKLYKGNGVGLYKQMIKDAQLLQGLSKGYYKDQTLEEQELKLEWVLDRHF